mgnify:CR=1 FL=1
METISTCLAEFWLLDKTTCTTAVEGAFMSRHWPSTFRRMNSSVTSAANHAPADQPPPATASAPAEKVDETEEALASP